MSDYAPGTVARVTLRGEKTTYRAIIGVNDRWWGPGLGTNPLRTSAFSVIRPLVVLDLTAHEADELASWLDGTDAHMGVCDRVRVARQIRKQTKPPRIPEPGLWGVVSEGEPGAFEGIRYVRDDAVLEFPWAMIGKGNRVAWHEIDKPVLVREGVQSW
jgi:hypothetical protein